MSKSKSESILIEKSQITLNIKGTKVVLSLEDLKQLQFQINQFIPVGYNTVYPYFSTGMAVTNLCDNKTDGSISITSTSVGESNE